MTDENRDNESPETTEAELIRVRRSKLDQIRQLGFDAWPTTVDYDTHIASIHDRHGDKSIEDLEAETETVAIAGRIIAVRDHGKTMFLTLAEGNANIQIYCRRDELDEKVWALVRLLDTGDWISVRGAVFRTKKGELSVRAASVVFLAKSLRPLPEKWHGLTDVEQRYRQRYLDLAVNEDSRRVFVTRAAIVRYIRRFFDMRGYVEVETPMMQPMAGGAAARPIVTHHNTLDLDLYLRVAPELYLKRLIVGGLQRVYEINRNFRNEGISTQHNPEFTMLEFYEAYSDYRKLMDLTEGLLSGLVVEINGGTSLTWREQEIDFKAPFERLTMKDAIVKYAGSRGMEIAPSDLDDHARLVDLVGSIGGHTHVRPDGTEGTGWEQKPAGLDRWNDGKLLAELFEAVAEPHLVQPTFIMDFPVEVSPLSKQSPDNPRIVERFELFVGGMELANAFSELNDPDEQERRFRQQLSERDSGDDEAHLMDEDYVRALEFGLPPTGGEGIGIDRLTMILTGSASIRDVILFPLLRPRG